MLSDRDNRGLRINLLVHRELPASGEIEGIAKYLANFGVPMLPRILVPLVNSGANLANLFFVSKPADRARGQLLGTLRSC